jgi:hypothetical protein
MQKLPQKVKKTRLKKQVSTKIKDYKFPYCPSVCVFQQKLGEILYIKGNC